MKHWKKMLFWLLIAALGLEILSYLAHRLLNTDPLLTQRASTSAAPALSKSLDQGLRIAAFNIAHGRGLASSNWLGGSREERKVRLEAIGKLLRDLDADVVVLNEVDFDATWSSGVNQAEFLANQAGYPYWVEQKNFNLWSVFLTLRFGNAILSRFPIQDVSLLEYPRKSWLDRLSGYRKRGVLTTLSVGTQEFRLVGIHLTHKSRDAREGSGQMLLELPNVPQSPLFLAGDFNSTPKAWVPASLGHVEGPTLMDILEASQRFHRMVLQKPQEQDWTFVTADWKFVIDWILIPPDWEFQSHRVHNDGDVAEHRLSDHRLIVADVRRRPESDEEPPQGLDSRGVSLEK